MHLPIRLAGMWSLEQGSIHLTRMGQRLLAHELAHTLQQDRTIALTTNELRGASRTIVTNRKQILSPIKY